MGLSLDIVENQNMTPLNYLGSKILHINDEVPSSRLVQFLLDTGELDGDIERFFMPEKVGLSCNFPALMWRIPGVLDMVIKRSIGLDSYYRLPLDARFQRLMWHYVAPEVLLNDIQKSGNLEPADFRPVLDFSPESSIYGFVWTYFRELIRDGIHYYYPNKMSGKVYNKFHHWRELARWVFGGLSARDLNQMKKRPPWPMRVFGGLVELQYYLLWVTHGIGRSEPRFAQKAFLIWLEDMQAAGVDLAEYGRQELEIYLTHGSLQSPRWLHENMSRDIGQLGASGWKLVGFTYGPEPEDWKFTWDLDAWEYAGDFWEQVENPPLRIPGGWVDDESW
ncbi:uncharacterized protein LY79DRAFT_281813 [Colletotrichum navitas]|uniref:Uncharacterized protein n=1 Tax=Colletotrichum navitas TaxID=681940 RepID=A0AAD8V3T4_9PEZI|nr:uncharacterized protein LY79DRAFT_281813 [Colletotrichum navitas]KAK1584994.1 hypothetical protein LY79DRAFT_281813 [Colletotrichum navitas]